MTKYRIVEEEEVDGNFCYYVQYRSFMIWWFVYKTETVNTYRNSFNNPEQAAEWIKKALREEKLQKTNNNRRIIYVDDV